MEGKTKLPNIKACKNYTEVKNKLIKAGFTNFEFYGYKKSKPTHYYYKYNGKEYLDVQKTISTSTRIRVGFGVAKKELATLIAIDKIL